MTRKQLHSSTPQFSYLGVPAATGMSDWYENDVTRFRKCFGVPEIFRIVIPAKAGIQKGWGWGNVARSKTSRGEGLLPDRGRGGAWQNPRPFAVPNHNSGFSYLGVPAAAGMNDCYESMSRTPIRDRPLRQPLIRHSRHPFANPAPHSSFRRRPESRGEGWHQPHPITSNDYASFSHLGVPGPAGMSDWYESMSRTTIRDRLLRQPLIRHLRHPFANPAPHSSFQRKLESRRGGEG